jgi:hypothetical protein
MHDEEMKLLNDIEGKTIEGILFLPADVEFQFSGGIRMTVMTKEIIFRWNGTSVGYENRGCFAAEIISIIDDKVSSMTLEAQTAVELAMSKGSVISISLRGNQGYESVKVESTRGLCILSG